MKKRVVFVTGSLRRGGAERVISIIANELVQRGWEVIIISILYSGIGYYIDPNVTVIDISQEKRNQIIDTPRIIRTLRKIIKDYKPNAVISFMLTVNIVTWIATSGIDTKFIPSERNDPSTGRGRLKHWLSCKAYQHSYKTVFQTQRARDYYSHRIQNNSVIIPNPVRVEMKCCDVKKKKIVSVGRIERQKNHKLLVESFYEVHKKYSDYSLHIYGDGSKKQELQELINNLELAECVYLHGNVNDIHNQIADSEFFVLSSDFEGLSNALLEAMMMGIPCISTDCAGSNDLIIDHESGIIVPVGCKEAMIEAMEYMIKNDDERIKYSINGSKIMERYRVDSIVDRWEDLLNN